VGRATAQDPVLGARAHSDAPRFNSSLTFFSA
jgi:hypothetical protein